MNRDIYLSNSLGGRKDMQSCKINIPLVLESTNSKKILQKEKINEIYSNNDSM